MIKIMLMLIMAFGLTDCLGLEKAIDQISGSVLKAIKYLPFRTDIGLKFHKIAPKIIEQHYYDYLSLEKPTKNDLLDAIYKTTLDLQLGLLRNRIEKRDTVMKRPDLIAHDLDGRREYLLKTNQDYQSLYEKEQFLQEKALDQQAMDFDNFLDSLENDEPIDKKPLLDFTMEILDTQLEKDSLESSILDNDQELKDLHQELVNIEPDHKYLKLEKYNQLEKLMRQIYSAKMIVEAVYLRIGVSKKTLGHLQDISQKMDSMISSNALYQAREKSPVAKEFQDILKNSPNPFSTKLLLTITMLIGISVPPVLFSMFSKS